MADVCLFDEDRMKPNRFRTPALPAPLRVLHVLRASVLRLARHAMAGTLGRMTMARRLALAFGLVLLLFAGTTLFAVLQMKALENDMRAAVRTSTDLSLRALARQLTQAVAVFQLRDAA